MNIRQEKMTDADRMAGQVDHVLARGGELGPEETAKLALIAAAKKREQEAETFAEAAFYRVERAKLETEGEGRSPINPALTGRGD